MPTLLEQYEELNPKKVNPYIPKFLGDSGTNFSEQPGVYISPESTTRYVPGQFNYGGFVNNSKPTLINLLGDSDSLAHEHAHSQQLLAGDHFKPSKDAHYAAKEAAKYGSEKLGVRLPLNYRDNPKETFATLQALESKLKQGQTIFDIPGMAEVNGVKHYALGPSQRRAIEQYMYADKQKAFTPEHFEETPKEETNYVQKFQQWIRNKTK